MKKEFIYTAELQNAPNDWIVYKEEKDVPDSKIGYQVELHAYPNDAHRCLCEWGMRQPNGQKDKFCKHVQMCVDQITEALNEMQGEISDNVIDLRDLPSKDMEKFKDTIQ